MKDEEKVNAARASRASRQGRGAKMSGGKKSAKKKAAARPETFTGTEQRAARSQRVHVSEAEPYGWIATSGGGDAESYTLYADPTTHKLVCVCADYIFRGKEEPGYQCKHVVATMLFIARTYLENDYDPEKQRARRGASDEGGAAAMPIPPPTSRPQATSHA